MQNLPEVCPQIRRNLLKFGRIRIKTGRPTSADFVMISTKVWMNGPWNNASAYWTTCGKLFAAFRGAPSNVPATFG